MINFKTHNDKDISVGGTSCHGYLDGASYRQLKKAFGKPINVKSGKVDVEWCIEFEDGEIATIYNYKDGKNYLGQRNGTPKTKITDWHVGGFKKIVVERLQTILKEQPDIKGSKPPKNNKLMFISRGK